MPLPQASWSLRLYELCAVLELYLIEMRRIDDRQGVPPRGSRVPIECQNGSCNHYPRLILDPHSTTPPLVRAGRDVKILYLTRHEISTHLNEFKGSPTDRFDHPIVFARSGYPLPDEDVSEKGQELVKNILVGDASWIDNIHERFGPNHEDNVDWHGPISYYLSEAADAFPAASAAAEAPSEAIDAASDYLREIVQARPVTEALPSVETVGGLLALARSLLALTPQVRTLSLTGIFHRLLSSPASIELEGLRALNIGPVLPIWNRLLRPSVVAGFCKLEELRICVPTLSEVEVAFLAGSHGALPRLCRLEWEMVDADDPFVR